MRNFRRSGRGENCRSFHKYRSMPHLQNDMHFPGAYDEVWKIHCFLPVPGTNEPRPVMQPLYLRHPVHWSSGEVQHGWLREVLDNQASEKETSAGLGVK